MGNFRLIARAAARFKKLFAGKPRPPFRIAAPNATCGRESYHNGNFAIRGRGKVTVGNFCALGAEVKLILSNHNYHFPSIQYSLYNRLFGEVPYEKKPGRIDIGHDVWIGDNVIVLPNVRIGNGACIGAGAVVTRDVPDFAIAAGNPARILKYRFSEQQIEKLNEIKWWLWDDAEILRNRAFFFQPPAE
jgi:acetyltransferase-like isoleucine patch superfamily enzyme